MSYGSLNSYYCTTKLVTIIVYCLHALSNSLPSYLCDIHSVTARKSDIDPSLLNI